MNAVTIGTIGTVGTVGTVGKKTITQINQCHSRINSMGMEALRET